MMVLKTVIFAYRAFGPYHVARLAHAREVFKESGMSLVPMRLFSDSRTYQWGNPAKLDGALSLDLNNAGSDLIRYWDIPRLVRVLAKLSPAVVFVNGWGTRDAIAMHAWCFKHRVPRVLVSDSTWEDKPRSGIVEFGKRVIVSRCSAAFAGGHPQIRYLKRLGISEDRITLGCDVVDNRHFASGKRRDWHRGRRLLTVARFEPEKNLLRAARSFLRFAATRPPDESWRWTIVGYGSQAAILHKLSASSQGLLSIEDFKTYEELPAVYADANLYFQPSIYEPWGLVINEAMAAGLPLLVSHKCGCTQDLVTRDVGWTFDPHSEESIVGGLHAAALGFDRWQKMGEAAEKQIAAWGLDRFSSGAVQAALLALRPKAS